MKNSLEYYATKDLTTVNIDTPVAECWRIMKSHKIRHLPVVNTGEIVGIISESDIQNHEPRATCRDLMRGPVKMLPYDSSLKEAVDQMVTEKSSAILVTRDREVVGIVTTEDLLKLLSSQLVENPVSLDSVLQSLKAPLANVIQGLSNSGI